MSCKKEQRAFLVERVNGKCATELEVGIGITVKVLLQWSIVIEILIPCDRIGLLYIVVPIVVVCTAHQHEWTEQCRNKIFTDFHNCNLFR